MAYPSLEQFNPKDRLKEQLFYMEWVEQALDGTDGLQEIRQVIASLEAVIALKTQRDSDTVYERVRAAIDEAETELHARGAETVEELNAVVFDGTVMPELVAWTDNHEDDWRVERVALADNGQVVPIILGDPYMMEIDEYVWRDR